MIRRMIERLTGRAEIDRLQRLVAARDGELAALRARNMATAPACALADVERAVADHLAAEMAHYDRMRDIVGGALAKLGRRAA